MPKIRTHSGTAKRIRTTKTGKLLHGHAHTNHFQQKKTADSKRRHNIEGQIEGKTRISIKRALGA